MNAFLTCVSLPAVMALMVCFGTSDISNIDRKPRVMHPALVICAGLVLVVGCFGALGLTIRSGSLWSDAYWLHDMRTGDGVRFTTMEPAAYADLKKRDYHAADDISPAVRMVLVQAKGSCPEEFVGQTITVSFGPLFGTALSVVGRATAPDYRYLVDVVDGDCRRHALITPAYLAILKSASKEAVGYSTQDSRHALESRAQAEAASAQPLR
jgi:hypothetical protein